MIEAALRELAPGRYDRYEALLQEIAAGELFMLLWHGLPGSPDVQYGNLEVGGYGYAPCVTSAEQLAASGWTRQHQVVPGVEVAAALYRERWGLWLDPHASGGGVGIPWADLRRIAGGLDRLPAGPLSLTAVDAPPSSVPESVGSPAATAPFFRQLIAAASETSAVQSLRRAWVEPSVGEPYVVLGLELTDSSAQSVDAVRQMMHRALPAAPDGLAVSTVALADPYDQVASWLSARMPACYQRV
ncbi:enhanced serine sensitivity protein SseB C-terminal domain-containing protein [Streptacidiphilus rugosus]|uniref:enhanced serine sensitivity protein SseB C-terminal domain-containing protein n=1 Tax=Streptacidiphilus rugosus TaxID=405783 RepID=UPI00068A2016|nr:enhanced serine sensitivity protein SseB C-terminal domain-containing protein [Streptacidiphilus rugosus]